MNEIIIYEDPDITIPVQVTLEGKTVWLTQFQMAELFQVKPQNITGGTNLAAAFAIRRGQPAEMGRRT